MRRFITVANAPDLLTALNICLVEQEKLCRDLEDLADSLPERLDTLGAAQLVERLRARLRQSHRLEEQRVFPLLLAAPHGRYGDLRPVMDRLRAEHSENEDYAVDLEDLLAGLGRQPLLRTDAERLGYLLRGLFVSLRRHVAQDRDWICPLLRELSAA